MKHLGNNRGYSIIELLTTLFITGVLASASFTFYVKMHNQTIAQEEISTMQQNSRSCIAEISKSLRMAGYKTGTHPAFSINGDSIYIFYSETQPIDSVLYYLADYSESELARFPEGIVPRRLMKKNNSDTPAIFSDYINNISFTAINSNTIEIVLEVTTSVPDEDFEDNDGFRKLTALENVNMRNAAL